MNNNSQVSVIVRGHNHIYMMRLAANGAGGSLQCTARVGGVQELKLFWLLAKIILMKCIVYDVHFIHCGEQCT